MASSVAMFSYLGVTSYDQGITSYRDAYVKKYHEWIRSNT